MLRKRIIPVLLLHNGGLFKTIEFSLKKGVYIGDPINAVKIFNEKEVDELIILDIDCSKHNREPNFELIKEIASECFMPIAYGGGLSKMSQVKQIIESGVEKVIINTNLLADNSIVPSLVSHYGAQSIVASIDVKRSIFGKYFVYNSASRMTTKITLESHLEKIQEIGVGEIFLSSISEDGKCKGYDWELLKFIKNKIKIPFIINCGAGNNEHLKLAVNQYGASASAASSIFLFQGNLKGILISYVHIDDL